MEPTINLNSHNTNRGYVASFYIAGFTYWEGCMAFGKLTIGTELKLVRERNNHYDPDAVAIYYGCYKLGYIPMDSHPMVSQMLDLGYDDVFEMRVQRLSPEAHPEKQVGVVLYIRNKATMNANKSKENKL